MQDREKIKQNSCRLHNNIVYICTCKVCFYWCYMNKIREVLKEKGMSQTKLSARLGKSFNMVNLYVANKHQPSIPTLYQIADILDVDVRDLLVPNKK